MTADELRSYDIGDINEALNANDLAVADPSVVGVVLASGTSTRFGEANKLLADLNGEPLVRHATRTLLCANLTDVVVVIGCEAEAVYTAIEDLDVRVVQNSDYEEGLSTTVAEGIRAVGNADLVVFLPGDMPAVAPATVRGLIDAYRVGLGTALAAAYDGQRGNPVLFDQEYFDALRGLDGDVGGRSILLESEGSALVAMDDPGVTKDIDTIEDLRRQH